MGWLVCVCVLQKLGINLCKFDGMACVCVCVAEVRYQSLQV